MSQETILRKTAYAAVGFPIQVMTGLRERAAVSRDMFDDLRGRFADQLQASIDEWADEGERVVRSLEEKVRARSSAVRTSVEEGAARAGEVGRGVAATVTKPQVPIIDIDGIGPAYADKLVKAGVMSTRALVERCDGEDAVRRLAEQTGIPARLLERWVASADLTRIRGVGADYMSLLNRLGIASVEAMAEQDAAELSRLAGAVADAPGLVESIPSQATLAKWIAEARDLAA